MSVQDGVQGAPNNIGPAAVAGIGPEQAVSDTAFQQQPSAANCPTCTTGTGNIAPSFIYAIGRIETRFPSLGVEKEFSQAIGRAGTAGQSDAEAFHTAFSSRPNRYLARQLCWILSIEGLETYILQPRDGSDLDLLIEAVRPTPSQMDVDVVIGIKGPNASPEMCNGLMVPLVIFDQIYSFDRNELIKSIPRPDKMTAEKFAPIANELLDRVLQLADNAGSTDEHRALNYLATRYPAIYATLSDLHGREFSLAAVDVRPSRLSGTRKIVTVIFSFAHRQTDVKEQYFVRVDVTEEFPFLVSKLTQGFAR